MNQLQLRDRVAQILAPNTLNVQKHRDRLRRIFDYSQLALQPPATTTSGYGYDPYGFTPYGGT